MLPNYESTDTNLQQNKMKTTAGTKVKHSPQREKRNRSENKKTKTKLTIDIMACVLRVDASRRARSPARELENQNQTWERSQLTVSHWGVHCHTVGLALGARGSALRVFEKPGIPEGAGAHLVVVRGGAADRHWRLAGRRGGRHGRVARRPTARRRRRPHRPHRVRRRRPRRRRAAGRGRGRTRRRALVRRVQRDAARPPLRRLRDARLLVAVVGQHQRLHVAHATVLFPLPLPLSLTAAVEALARLALLAFQLSHSCPSAF